MRLHGFELRRVAMPLVSPFRTSFGTQTERDVLLVRALTDDADGWGECVTLRDPLYSPEYVDGAVDVMRRHLHPGARPRRDRRARASADALKPFKGHRMSKAALEMAVLDAELRSRGAFVRPRARLGARPRAVRRLGRASWTRFPSCSTPSTATSSEGYVRIKLKIEPGWDIDAVRAVRETLRRRRAAAGRREHRVHPARRPSPRQARRLRPAPHRAAARGGGHPRPRRSGEDRDARRSASTSRSRRRRPRPPRSGSARPR